MIDKLREQFDDLAKARKIAPVSDEQFFITLAGSCLFSFAARPMIAEGPRSQPDSASGIDETATTELPAFLKGALAP